MLSPADAELLAVAIQARQRAFAPYSGYLVGAAVRGASGTVYTGCNVEVSSFSLTCCAERVAVFKAISEGEPHITGAAVVTADEVPGTPCGACRQVLHEFGPGITMIMGNTNGAVRQMPIAELLPHAFGQDWVLPFIRRSHGGG
jgi:cytidine deaminase